LKIFMLQISYMKESHGDWLGVEHNSALANELKAKYGISGIPSLIVVKADGSLVTKDGRYAMHCTAMCCSYLYLTPLCTGPT